MRIFSVEMLDEKRIKERIDEFYKTSLKFLYLLMDIKEYATIRILFVLAHMTSVIFGILFFGALGKYYFKEIYIIGIVQCFGAMIFMTISVIFKGVVPFHQLQLLSSTSLLAFGGYRVLVYFPRIDVFYYMIVCGVFTAFSYIGIYLMKKLFPKLDIEKNKED